jgi:thiol:disulfide interchange protein DsbD
LFLVKMPRFFLFLACVAACLAAALPVRADNPLKIELVSEVTSIQPGQPFYVGLHLEHPKGYHTYWKFPGIVGVPTAAKWTLPKGFSAGPIEWPEPQRVFMYQIAAQGYHDEVMLPVLITPPKDLKPGTTVKLATKASWMCCGQDCNPGFQDLTLELPVKEATPAPDAHWQKRFQLAHQTVPGKLEGWVVSAKREADRVTLLLTAQSEAAQEQCVKVKDATFFTEDGFINADKEQHFAKPRPGVITIGLVVSEYATNPSPKQFTGVIRSPQGWAPDARSHSVRVVAPLLP